MAAQGQEGMSKDRVILALGILRLRLLEALSENRWPDPADMELADALSGWWIDHQALSKEPR